MPAIRLAFILALLVSGGALLTLQHMYPGEPVPSSPGTVTAITGVGDARLIDFEHQGHRYSVLYTSHGALLLHKD